MVPNNVMILKYVAGAGSPTITQQHKSCQYAIRYAGPHSYVAFLAQTVDGLHLGLQPAEGIGYLLSQP